MTTIKILTARRFRFLWLKSVTGFRENVHCARCLVGDYHTGLNPAGMKAGDQVEVEIDPAAAPFWYLCGVSSSWPNNMHVPMRSCPGAGPIELDLWGVRVEISGGVEVVPMPPVDPDVPAEFGTCRNWLFGRGYLGADRYAAIASSASS